MTHRHTLLLLGLLVVLLARPVAAQAPEPPPTPMPIPDPADDPQPRVTSSEYWVTAGLDRAWYDLSRRATNVLWVVNKVLFTTADLLSVFRVTMANTFDNVLGVLGTSLVDVAVGIAVPGILVALILLLLGSVVRFPFASVRRGFLTLIAVPVIFGSLGILYSTVETLGLELTNALSGAVYDAAIIEIAGTDVADLEVYNPDAPNRLVDVAAAMLFVREADVEATGWALPATFEAAFYTPAPTNWSTIGWHTREVYQAQATAGLVRMVFAVTPCVLMVVDALIHAGWTSVIAALFASLTVVLCFVVFAPFAASAVKIVTLIFHALVTSSAISVVQGVLVAVLVWVTRQGNASYILIASIAILLMYLSFLAVVGVLLVRGVINLGAAPIADDAVGERALHQAGGLVLGGLVGGVAGAVGAARWADRQHPSAHDLAAGVGAFVRDKRFGESNAHALGYALGPSHAGQRLAKAGLLSGFMDVDGDFNRGVYDAAIVDRGRVNSYKAVNRQAWNALPDEDDDQGAQP